MLNCTKNTIVFSTKCHRETYKKKESSDTHTQQKQYSQKYSHTVIDEIDQKLFFFLFCLSPQRKTPHLFTLAHEQMV